MKGRGFSKTVGSTKYTGLFAAIREPILEPSGREPWSRSLVQVMAGQLLQPFGRLVNFCYHLFDIAVSEAENERTRPTLYWDRAIDRLAALS
jgi:hypothetical protein